MKNPGEFRLSVGLFSPLILILSVAFLVAACAGPKPDEIIAKALDSASKVDTYKSETTTDFQATSGDSYSGNQTLKQLSSASTAIVDKADGKSHVYPRIGPSGPTGENLESYNVEGYVYVHWLLPGAEDWVKLKIPTGEAEARNGHFVINILKSASLVTGHGTQRVNGTDSYIVEITPKVEPWVELRTSIIRIFGVPGLPWLMSLGATSSEGLLPVPPDDFKMAATYWIDKKTFLFNQVEIALSFSIESTNVDVKSKIRFYDYNKEVTISLPPEAQKTVEVSP